MNYDAIIIVAGHNGLVCSFYLAKKGLKVLILESQPQVGGAAVTDEFLPGFRNSAASYTVSLLQPKVIRDLDLDMIRRVRNDWQFYRDRRPESYTSTVKP